MEHFVFNSCAFRTDTNQLLFRSGCMVYISSSLLSISCSLSPVLYYTSYISNPYIAHSSMNAGVKCCNEIVVIVDVFLPPATIIGFSVYFSLSLSLPHALPLFYIPFGVLPNTNNIICFGSLAFSTTSPNIVYVNTENGKINYARCSLCWQTILV